MRSGDRPGLQNRREAFAVAGGFDSHSLPPFFPLLSRMSVFLPAEKSRLNSVVSEVFRDSELEYPHFIQETGFR